MGRRRRSDRQMAAGRRRTPASWLRRFASLSPFAFGALFLAGCSGLRQVVGNDPLVGGPALRPSLAAAPPPPAPVAVLPPPAATSTLSTAALAAAAPRSADRGRD